MHEWKFTEKSDVWSYGVTLYELFSLGKEPNLPGMEEAEEADELQVMFTLLMKGVRLRCPETCPEYVYRNLMCPCWELNPQSRPTFSKIFGEIINIKLDGLVI